MRNNSYSAYSMWFQPKQGTAPAWELFPVGDDSHVIKAAEEWTELLGTLWDSKPRVKTGRLILGVYSDVSRITGEDLASPGTEGYSFFPHGDDFIIAGGDGTGVLYGMYRLILMLCEGKSITDYNSSPAYPIRIINHWDNMDGSVERGYAGRSLFFENEDFDYNPSRIRLYARFLASVGINRICINNVNVGKCEAGLLEGEKLEKLVLMANILREYAVRMVLAVAFDSPIIIGGLQSADPLDGEVRAWWKTHVSEIYNKIPDLGGFLVKADSEFRAGPFTYGREQSDGANMFAEILLPYGGYVFWRCFVYNCRQDWRDVTVDRPRAAYDHFMPLDGKFADNVILQIKLGPSDFQPREPVSPLLGAMKKTNQALEVQITQEYTGQQKDLYYLAGQWSEVFNFDTHGNGRIREIKKIVAVAGVSNLGREVTWTGHVLAGANFYAFGRLSWNPELSAQEVAEEWVKLTFGNNPEVTNNVTHMLMCSRKIFEKYTTPLGLGWMVNPGHHYGASPEGYEYDKWGTYHRADLQAIGVDRTARGTGYTKQYTPGAAEVFENLDTCPEELLLYFHRVRYDYRLKSGKTLLQHIYDTHFEGVEDVLAMIDIWDSLKSLIPEEAWQNTADKLHLQLLNSEEWRDVINSYFYRKTGIPDEKGRKIYI